MDTQANAHWSGTFQRLRAECVVMSLLIAVFTHYGVNLQKIPVLGVELQKSASSGQILIMLLAFQIYFSAAWFTRYLVEVSAIGPHYAEILEAYNNLKVDLSDVQTIFKDHPQSALNTVSNSTERFIAASDTVIREVKRYDRAISWDRKVLGFQLPMLFCIAMLALSAPQFVQDTEASWRSIEACVTHPTRTCLMRQTVKSESAWGSVDVQ